MPAEELVNQETIVDSDINFNPSQAPEPSVVADSVGSDPAAPVSAPAASDFVSIRDAARVYGVDLSQFQDDRSALAHLLQGMQTANQSSFYTNLGRQIAPHYDVVRQALQSRQQAVPAQQASVQPWQRPDFDESWLSMVEKDPNSGVFVAKPGVNPMIAEKVQAASQWMQKFARDPFSVIEPFVKHLIDSQVQERIDQSFDGRIGQMREQSEIQGVVQANAEWLYLRDQNGNVVMDPMSRKAQPSPAGALYVRCLSEAAQLGIRGARNQDAYALRILQGEIARHQVSQAQPPTNNGQINRPNINQPNTLTEPTRRNLVPGTTDQPTGGKSLDQLLRDAFNSEGVQDSDFAIAS